MSCIITPPQLDRLYFYTEYTGAAKNLIQTMKFRSLKSLSLFLGSLMAGIDFPPVDAVVPIPLSKERLIQRGFNQSYYMAKVISSTKGLPLEHLLLRKLNTPAQSGLNKKDRQKNIRGAFQVDRFRGISSIVPGRILLVDDVYTTGATLNEAAMTLKTAGTKTVFALVFARTPFDQN
ncbi:MAG: ComF family protein [Nitrospirae bacterium]|nr:ComF family protein [Nitrospirota bacterium]